MEAAFSSCLLQRQKERGGNEVVFSVHRFLTE